VHPDILPFPFNDVPVDTLHPGAPLYVLSISDDG
jgi:hypothetical protein